MLILQVLLAHTSFFYILIKNRKDWWLKNIFAVAEIAVASTFQSDMLIWNISIVPAVILILFGERQMEKLPSKDQKNKANENIYISEYWHLKWT